MRIFAVDVKELRPTGCANLLKIMSNESKRQLWQQILNVIVAVISAVLTTLGMN